MAHRVKNIKRFMIIKTHVVELSVIDGRIVPGICDFCNKPHYRGFVVPVLGHWWSCRKCLSAWLKRAEPFPEDAEFERLCFNEYKSRFAAKGLWRDGEYLINVANVCWVRKFDDTRVEIKFSNGPSEIFYNNGLELTEMMIGRPWYINVFNAIRWLFRKKQGVNK